jgi:transposase
MEATGVYWKPCWAVLEGRFECMLVNARHVKQVPGRKTDVSDAAWLCQLLEAGLLRGSFVPPKPIRALRTLTRYRRSQIKERAREANRLHKVPRRSLNRVRKFDSCRGHWTRSCWKRRVRECLK